MTDDDQFDEAFDAREAERFMSGLEVIMRRHLGTPDSDRVARLIERTRRDLDLETVRKLSGFDDEFRAKRHDETDAQWKARVAQADLERVSRMGDLVPPEARQHSEMVEATVMHVESYTLARTVRVNSRSPIEDMFERGGLTTEQFDAACEIVGAVELIERDVSFRGASLEARVDCSGSAKGLLAERLALVRAEVAYSLWRQVLPMPRRLVIDMLVQAQPMTATARAYRINWRTARKRLIKALDNWITIREKTWANVDDEDLKSAHYRIGGGVIL